MSGWEVWEQLDRGHGWAIWAALGVMSSESPSGAVGRGDEARRQRQRSPVSKHCREAQLPELPVRPRGGRWQTENRREKSGSGGDAARVPTSQETRLDSRRKTRVLTGRQQMLSRHACVSCPLAEQLLQRQTAPSWTGLPPRALEPSGRGSILSCERLRLLQFSTTPNLPTAARTSPRMTH